MAKMNDYHRVAAMTVFCRERFRINAWKRYYSEYKEYLSLHVIINNGDAVDTQILKQEFPDSQIIECETQNLLAAYNKGLAFILRHSEIDSIMQITNDVRFKKGAINMMLSLLFSKPEIGVVGPILYKKDSAIVESFGWKLHPRFGFGTPVFHGMTIPYNNEETSSYQEQVTFIPAGAVMVKREAWEKVGFQDEKLFMYQDERDFALRLKKEGYIEIATTSAKAWHQHQNAPGRNSRPLSSIYYSSRNRIYVTKKHSGTKYAMIEFLFLAGYTFILSLSHIIRGRISDLKYDKTTMMGLIDGIKGIMYKKFSF